MVLNQQPIEKADLRDDGTLDLHSIFYTLQGEGPFTGRRAVFVRLAGCNLRCPGCDTEYTQGRARVSIKDILFGIRKAIPAHHTSRKPLIVITGGEPFRQDLSSLCFALLAAYYPVQIETNGVLGLHAGMKSALACGVNVVVSPKTSRIHDDWSTYASAFKYVLAVGEVSRDDLLPLRALHHPAKPQVARPPEGYRGPIYVNPMDEKDPVKNAANLQLVAEAALRFGYTAGTQLHKLLNLE